MAAQVKSGFHPESHSKIVSKNTPTRSSKKQNMSSVRGEELLKAMFRKGNNGIERKQVNDSKKKSICNHNQQNQGTKELLKVVRKGTEKLSIKESKCKLGTHSRVCFCAPTTHEGSFRCRLHRKKSAADSNSNLRLNFQRTHGIMEFQPQLSRFGRVPRDQIGTHDSLIKLSRMESV